MEDDRPSIEAPPPLLGSWRNLYVVVIANLAFLVLVFWLITRAYAP